jgi:hypothetical protein
MLTTYPMKHSLKSLEIHILTRVNPSAWKASDNYGKYFKLLFPKHSILQYTPKWKKSGYIPNVALVMLVWHCSNFITVAEDPD